MRQPFAQLLERTFSATEREVIHRLLRSCGQVRRFAPDPIPLETLQRIIDAAMAAPFVGDRPPWHLILVTSPARRAMITAAVAEDGGREASTRPAGRAPERSGARTRARLGEAPLHLAVTYARGRDGSAAFDQGPRVSMDIYRACGAIQNLWLAACAEGLGVAWVRLADEGAVARLLALPPGVQLIAYLGLGIPQAFYARPRREGMDWCAQEHFDSRLYTDIWGGGCAP